MPWARYLTSHPPLGRGQSVFPAYPRGALLGSQGRAAYPFLPPPGTKGSELALGPLASGAEATSKQGLASSHPKCQAGQAQGALGGVTNPSQSPACFSGPVCLGPCPTMTGPSFSLARLLTVLGLLCYSACCLGESCVRACSDGFGKKKTRKADLSWDL